MRRAGPRLSPLPQRPALLPVPDPAVLASRPDDARLRVRFPPQVCWDKDGEKVAACFSNNTVAVLDFKSGTPM